MNQPYRILKDFPNPASLAGSGWNTPDSSILREGRRSPPTFPIEVLGPWRDWVGDAASGAGSPVDYVAGALLASIATLVGNSRSVSPWPKWEEPSVLWVGALGDPSTGKSPAFDPVLNALRKVEVDLGANFSDVHLEWATKKEMAKATEDDWKSKVALAAKNGEASPQKPVGAIAPEEPTMPRIIVSDVTPEALGVLLAANPKGILNYRDELTGWLSSFKRYSSGDSRGMWIEAFNARPYIIDRKTSGALHIPRLAVSILGGIQPDRLNSILLGADDDGLGSRFLWIWPDPVSPKRPGTYPSDDFIAQAFAHLRLLDAEFDDKGKLRRKKLELARDAVEVFQAWREQHFDSQRTVAGILKSAWGKMPGLLLRLSLLLELGNWAITRGREPNEVGLTTVQSAIHLMESYIKPMSMRVYGDTAFPKDERNATVIARWLLAKGYGRLNARDLRRTAGLPGLQEPQAVDAAISILVEANWLKPCATSNGAGRKAKNFDVNPLIRSLKT